MEQIKQAGAEHPTASSAFKCDQESFNNSYTKTDHLQKEMNQNIIKKFAERIVHYYE